MGLVNHVVEDEKVAATAEEMASQIIGNAPMTVDAVKFIANQTRMDESQRDLRLVVIWCRPVLTVPTISKDAVLSWRSVNQFGGK